MEIIELELTDECAAALKRLARSMDITESVLVEGMFLKHMAEKNAAFTVWGSSPQIYIEYQRNGEGEPIRGTALYEMLRETFLKKEQARYASDTAVQVQTPLPEAEKKHD